MAIELLAILPVISGLLFLFMSCGLSVELTQFALTPVKILTNMPGLWKLKS